jgi:hypothetical protein
MGKIVEATGASAWEVALPVTWILALDSTDYPFFRRVSRFCHQKLGNRNKRHPVRSKNSNELK